MEAYSKEQEQDHYKWKPILKSRSRSTINGSLF